MQPRLDYGAAAPDGMRGLNTVHAYIARSGLPRELIDLVYLRVSLINGCAYCIDLHTADLREQDIAPAKIALVPVWREAETLFTPAERAALAWAETVTRVAETEIPDEAFAAVSTQFEGRALADLTIAISLMNAFNRLAIAFRRTPPSAVPA